MRKSIKRFGWGVVCLLASQGVMAASWTLGALPSYFTGYYGTQSRIGIFYVPAYLQYHTSQWRVKLTVPYIAVSGLPQGASLTGGTLAQRGGGTMAQRGGGTQTTSSHTTSSQTSNPSGLGDIWLAAHYTLLPEEGLRPAVVPYVKVKFGTASAAEGLGTGRNDYEAGCGFNTTVGTNVFPFVHIAYRIVGSPPGQHLQNIVTFNGGASIAASSRTIFTVMYAGAGSEQAGYAGPADVIASWNFNVTRAGSGFQVYLDKGLSNGSADVGGGVGGQIVF